MKKEQIDAIVDGSAYLEYVGNLYEHTGYLTYRDLSASFVNVNPEDLSQKELDRLTKGETLFVFSDVNNGDPVYFSLDELQKESEKFSFMDITQHLMDQLYLHAPMDVQKKAWVDFVEEHGYAIVSSNVLGDFVSLDYTVPGTYRLSDPEDCGWADALEKISYPRVDPVKGFIRDGGKFINDIYGLELNTYLDFPENRATITQFLAENPEYGIQNWKDEALSDKQWESYQNHFKEIKNAEFFAEIKPGSPKESEMISKLCGMTGEQAYDAYGLNRDEVITNTASFPNGVEIDVKLVIGDGDEPNWCEAVIFKNGNDIGGLTDMSDDYFGQWELEDRDGNQYHIFVAPNRELDRDKVKAAEDNKKQKNLGR